MNNLEKWLYNPGEKEEFAKKLGKKKSQRTDGFRAGIQTGQQAGDEASIKLDTMLKELKGEIYQKIAHLGITYDDGISQEWMQNHADRAVRRLQIGLRPDGGIWYYNGWVIIFEAKKQGEEGNALERWEKNYNRAKLIWPFLRYITLGVGEYFAINNKGKDNAGLKHASDTFSIEPRHIIDHRPDTFKELNNLYSDGVSWFVNPAGFDRTFVKQMMLDGILGNNLIGY